jgi:hypothetical protein
MLKALTNFRTEDEVLGTSIKKLSMSDETGVDVFTGPSGQYSTDEKYKVKKPKNFSPGCE